MHKFVESKRLKVSVCAFALMLMTALSVTPSYAYNTYNNHKCNRGVAVLYYIYPEATPFLTDINQAAYRWTQTPTKVSLGRTYSTSPSTIDIFYRYDSGTYKYANAWIQYES